MEFIDHTGHIFSIPSYSEKPVGYQYDVNKYIFWINNPYNTHKLSVGQWYIESIRPVVDLYDHNIESVEIKIHDSSIYYLIGPNMIQEQLEKNKSVIDAIELDPDDFKKTLENDDLQNIIIEKEHNSIYNIIPFYIACKNDNEGAITTNILIHVTYDDYTEDWCPITVGGEFYDENEPLVINGKNIGIDLPKDILKAVYDCSYYDSTPDYIEWNEKMKELLLSFMHIKGECGNYESAIDALKWFGYGDKIEINSLIKTDNQFLSQYILDQFSLDSDIIQSFKKFKQTSYISLYIACNEESDKEDLFKWNEDFFGEGKPFTEDLFKKLVPIYHDEEDLPFWKPYYDWTFNEMALKIAILKYMYKKYFLPMHLLIHVASFKHRVFVNDNKFVVGSYATQTETPTILQSNETSVEFPSDSIYIYNQVHYFDTLYNEIDGYNILGTETNEEILYINDICASLPIKFSSNNSEQIFNCHLILFRNETKILETDFSFLQIEGSKEYNSLIIIPKQLNPDKNLNYWIDKSYRIALLCNGKWYYHDFIIKKPEFHLNIGKLIYEYNFEGNTEWIDLQEGDEGYLTKDDQDYYDGCNHVQLTNYLTYHKQISSITDEKVNFNSFMYVPSLVEVADMTFFDKLNLMTEQMSWERGSKSKQEYCEYVLSKCYIYELGVNTIKDTYVPGDEITPMFYFNNGTLSNDVGIFKLAEYKVDVYFGYQNNGNYYACIKNFDVLAHYKDGEPISVYSRDIEYPNYSELIQQIENKENVGIESIFNVTTDVNGNTFYSYKEGITEEDKTNWYKFYVDKIVRRMNILNIRVVSSGKISTGNNTHWTFGGYKTPNDPTSAKIFQDISLNIENTNNFVSSQEICDMQCDLYEYCKIYCKFKNPELITYPEYIDENKPKDIEYVEGLSKQQQIVSTNIYNGIESMLKEIAQSYNIPNSDDYYNMIHIYNICKTKNSRNIRNINQYWKYDNSLDIVYDGNEGIQSKELISIYRDFFNDDGTQKISLLSDSTYDYDLYLMHDDEYWFAVFISQMPISYKMFDSDLEGPEELIFTGESGFTYLFKHYRSNKKFLINRMRFVNVTPKYHFNSDDILVATIDNVKFPFILEKGTKWKIEPFSFGINSDNCTVYSNTNSAIISIGDKNNQYSTGYYVISVRYSVDGNTQNQEIKKAKLLIQ